MKIAILLAVVAAAANIFLIWLSKKSSQTKTDESSNTEISYPFSKGYQEQIQARCCVTAQINMAVTDQPVIDPAEALGDFTHPFG